jgi:adenosylcobinamide-GDP ribazoletransferase
MSQPPAFDAEQGPALPALETPGTPSQRRASGFLLAAQFLTIIPLRVRSEIEPGGPDMGRALPWFPLSGALLGAGVVALNWALTPVFSRTVRDVIALAAPLLATGMLHFDGFVDCCDALLGTRTVARRLEVLRDSRVGAFGVGGGAVLLLARFAALESLAPGLWALAVVAAPLVSRLGMVWVITLFRYARAQGAGSRFHSGPARLALTCAMALLLLGALAVLAPWGTLVERAFVLAALASSGLSVALMGALWASRRLGGGVTGDVYGAANELAEVAILALAPAIAQLALAIM